MTRRSTLSPEWKDLLEAVGGVGELCDTLDMSPTTFYRAVRGYVKLKTSKQEMIDILCNLHDVKNPLERRQSTPPARNRSLEELVKLGEAIEQEQEISPEWLERIREDYPEEQLVELAESDHTPTHVLLAVTRLLE